MTRWPLADATPRTGRAAVLGTATLLLLGLVLGATLGFGLAKLVEVAHLEDIAGQFRGPAAADPLARR